MKALQTVDARVNGARVVLACDESAVAEAKTFVTSLLQRVAHGLALRDGLVLPLGWSQLVLRKDGEDFVAHEPSYATNPLVALRKDCTTTLAVHREMVAAAAQRGVAPEFPRFSDRLLARQGWAHQPVISAARAEPRESGWRIDFEHSDAPFGALRIYELLGSRPSVLAALALPVGTTVRFDGDRLV